MPLETLYKKTKHVIIIEDKMPNRDRKQFYFSMLTILKGLQDDFDSNDVAEEAKGLLTEILEICQAEYHMRFSK